VLDCIVGFGCDWSINCRSAERTVAVPSGPATTGTARISFRGRGFATSGAWVASRRKPRGREGRVREHALVDASR
jgi:hypothetical protein